MRIARFPVYKVGSGPLWPCTCTHRVIHGVGYREEWRSVEVGASSNRPRSDKQQTLRGVYTRCFTAQNPLPLYRHVKNLTDVKVDCETHLIFGI